MLKYSEGRQFLSNLINRWEAERKANMGRTRDIQAVYEDDVENFLETLGILDELDNNLVKCYFCEKPVTRQNFGACFPADAIIAVCCDNPECIMKVMRGNQ